MYQSIEDQLSQAQREIVSLRRAHLDLDLAHSRFVTGRHHRTDIFPDVAVTVTNIRKALDSYVNPMSSIGFMKSIVPNSYGFYMKMIVWMGWFRRNSKGVEMIDELQLWVKRAYEDGRTEDIHEPILKKLCGL